MYKNDEYDDDIAMNFDLTEAGYKFFKKALTNKNGCFFIAYDGKKMVGYANGGAKEYSYRNKRYFEIENIGVIPNYKRKGIGKRLLQKILDWTKSRNFERIHLNCYIKNQEALKFYRKLGFKEIDVSLEIDLE